MNQYICKAKSLYGDKWVYGYYVQTRFADRDSIIHLIIDQNSTYNGMGEFRWGDLYRVDPNTVCRCADSTNLMEA